jgi:hypothetical protein
LEGDNEVKLTEETLCSEEYIKAAAVIKGRARPYPMCVALGQIYNDIEDPSIRLKIRYITTIAIKIATRLAKLDPVGIRQVYASYADYEELTKRML